MHVLHAIGNTAIVRLRKVVPPGSAAVLAKLEWENPTGSLKDRMAAAVIAKAEADGRLKPGDTVVEYTGGSTGASLALAREEGLFAGTSSGANVVAALQVAARLGPGATVVTLMVDSGLKYLHTDLYGKPPAPRT